MSNYLPNAQADFNPSRRRLFTRSQNSTSAILPWLKDADWFTHCTQCGDCIQACDPQIIKKGDGGFPNVDFSQGECTFCYQCAAQCPIQDTLFNDKQQAPWHLKAQINDQCLTKQQNVECRNCGEICEPQAIKYQLSIGHAAQPIINNDKCTGCGACVANCPTQAIIIGEITC